MPSVSRFITFRVSHYCEKASWALDRSGFPYVEECHIPLLHRLKTTPLGGKSVPVLVTDAGIFTTSSEILKYLDQIVSADAKLYPSEPELYHEVCAL